MRNERGFSLIELIIVMVIVAILMAIVIPMFHGARSSTERNEAIAAGSAYSSAIAQFQADHGNMLPSTATDMTTLNGKPAGPVNLLGKAYVRQIPSGVVEGRVGASIDGSSCSPLPTGTSSAPQALGWVSYCVPGGNLGGNKYFVTVAFRADVASPWQAACTTGTAPPVGAKPC